MPILAGTVDSITMIETKYLGPAGNDAHHEPEVIDVPPQAVVEIRCSDAVLDSEFIKMLRHIGKLYLLCIAIALAAIAVVTLFR